MNNIENLEALNNFLSEIEDKNYKLERKVEEMEREKDYSNWEWLKHKPIQLNDYRKDLPCPRLEMNIFSGDYRSGWITGIVYPDYGEQSALMFVPLTMTTTSTDLSKENPSLPWKDEFHLYSYSRIFNLKMYLTRNSDCLIKELHIKPEFESNINSHMNKFCRI